jgi:hypothetical protein
MGNVVTLPRKTIAMADHAAVVEVQSAWWSKINWTQAVGFVCSAISLFFGHQYDVPLDLQAQIVLVIQGITAVVTWVLKTFFSSTVTPNSAAQGAVVDLPPGTGATVEPVKMAA